MLVGAPAFEYAVVRVYDGEKANVPHVQALERLRTS